jgi:pimeloyl-ACP methyl ester carboxylesterase
MNELAGRRERFWITGGGAAPMYVESERPAPQGGDASSLQTAPSPASEHPPLVLFHGGGGQGTDWLTTPDGRPGWAPALVARGYPVYVVDRPGHGRGAAHAGALGEMGPPPTLAALAGLFRPPPGAHPTAELHTQWPSGDIPLQDDPALWQLLAASRPMPVDLAVAHELELRAGVALLSRTGPAILITHSAGAPAGWLLADARPDLVTAIVALEPFGPPFRPAGGGLPGLPYGLTAAPLPSGLRETPILLVSAEASAQRHFDAETQEFLERSGGRVQLLRLADHGQHGNGHGMIFELNHLEVLDLVLGAIEARLRRSRRSER